MDPHTHASRSGIFSFLLGLPLVLMILVILLGSLTAVGSIRYFSGLWSYIDLQARLEDQVSQDLRQMQIYELNAVFNAEYERPPDSSVEDTARSAGQVRAGLEQFIQQGQADKMFGRDEATLAQGMLAGLAAHQETFARVVQLYQAGDIEQARNLMETATQENEDLQEALQHLTFSLDASRIQAEGRFPTDIAQAQTGIGAAVVLMILLALVGYRSIGRLVQPLLNLTNAVIAIGGDRYQPALIESILRQRSQAGRLAHGLDAFARAIEQRDAALKTQIDSLRQQFYAARRSRLKITAPSQSEER